MPELYLLIIFSALFTPSVALLIILLSLFGWMGLSDYVRAEFAILVRSDLKGKGLGWRLMQHLIAYARAEGLQEIYGQVLATNVTMLNMCSELGFAIEAPEADVGLRLARLQLGGPSA